MQWRRKLQLQNRISTPKRQKDDFEALFKRNLKRKISSAKIEKICWQITSAALRQPFQYDLRSSAAKDKSITHAAAAPSNLDPATPIYARGNIKWRQWISDSNAICNQRFKNRIELRTQTQPLVAKHIGGTIRGQNDRSRTRRTDEVPFIVGCSHFTRKNTRFGAPASSPKHSPCSIHAAIAMRFATSRGKPAPIYARGNIKWRQWSSDSNAICNQVTLVASEARLVTSGCQKLRCHLLLPMLLRWSCPCCYIGPRPLAWPEHGPRLFSVLVQKTKKKNVPFEELQSS